MSETSQNLKENKTQSTSGTRKTENKPYKGKKSFFRNKNFFFVKKKCYFTKNKITYIDFRDIDLLRRFLKKSGQIISNRITGVTNINQRKLAKAVKRARFMGLLPLRGILPSNRPFNKNFSNDYKKNRNMERDGAPTKPEKKVDSAEPSNENKQSEIVNNQPDIKTDITQGENNG